LLLLNFLGTSSQRREGVFGFFAGERGFSFEKAQEWLVWGNEGVTCVLGKMTKAKEHKRKAIA